MSRALLGLAAVGLVSGCALIDSSLNKVGNQLGDSVGRATEQTASQLVSPELRAKSKRCDEFKSRPVPYEEEVQIGGAVALALAEKTDGVFVEIAPDLASLDALSPEKLKYQKFPPATGPKTNLHASLDRIGKGLAAFSSRPDIDWTFVVLDSPTPNAFSAPGGYVFVTTALLKKMQNEAQLAGVLAHEIGHVTGRHALKAYSKSKTDTCHWALGGAVLSGFVQSISKEAMKSVGESWGKMLDLPKFDLDKASGEFITSLTLKLAETIAGDGNSKEDEFDADKTAFELMLFAGYDYREFEKLLKSMPDGGGTFDHHPKNVERVASIEKTRTQAYADFSMDSLKAPPNPREFEALKK